MKSARLFALSLRQNVVVCAKRPSYPVYTTLGLTRNYHVRNSETIVLSGPIPGENRGRMGDAIESTKPHIGVIGAGAAGLRCSDVLLRHGFAVTVLEGRDRLGGRLHQERLPNGHLIDVGPNWIHGVENSPIADLAVRTGTVTASLLGEGYVFDEDGTRLSPENSAEDFTTMWNMLSEAYEYSRKHTAEIGTEKSLMDYFYENIAERIPEKTPGSEVRRRRILRLAALWGSYVGSPVTRQSLKFLWLENCIDDESLFCAGTYQKIVREIARPVLESAEIEYQAIVSGINGRRPSSSGKVTLTTTDGRTFEFDDVVMTAPLGWLKKNLGAFNPSLPDRLCSAIQSIGYGCLEKVYISFPNAFWSVSDSDQGTAPAHFEWLAPSYALDSNPERWMNGAVSLSSMPGSTAQPTLLFYVHGPASEHITSKVRSLATKREKDEFLFSFFEPYYSRLPNYDGSSPDCQPSGGFSTDWLHDDLAGNGSYGNFQVGLQNGDQDIRVMQAGAPELGIWLAGEHVAPLHALGTVTGAYQSGEHVAERIAQAYGKRVGADGLGKE